MAIPFDLDLVCIGEGELLQWLARGRLHILRDRIFVAGEVMDGTPFASCAAFKLDDAKARVIVTLKPDWSSDLSHHPDFSSKAILSLPLPTIREVAPTLPQYKRRLEATHLKIADWTAEEEWEDWLLTQGIHERHVSISDELRRIGFNFVELLEDDF